MSTRTLGLTMYESGGREYWAVVINGSRDCPNGTPITTESQNLTYEEARKLYDEKTKPTTPVSDERLREVAEQIMLVDYDTTDNYFVSVEKSIAILRALLTEAGVR